MATTSCTPDRKSTRLNSSHTVIYTLSLHDALPISDINATPPKVLEYTVFITESWRHIYELGDGYYIMHPRSEEHTSELQSHRDLHSFPTRRSSDLGYQRDASQSARIHSIHNGELEAHLRARRWLLHHAP